MADGSGSTEPADLTVIQGPLGLDLQQYPVPALMEQDLIGVDLLSELVRYLRRPTCHPNQGFPVVAEDGEGGLVQRHDFDHAATGRDACQRVPALPIAQLDPVRIWMIETEIADLDLHLDAAGPDRPRCLWETFLPSRVECTI